MKISKLFHSLYALLMLAPVFAVGGAMAFNIINDKAVDNAQNEDITYQKVNYLYETNDTTPLESDPTNYNLIEGNIYLLRLYSYEFDSSVLLFDYNDSQYNFIFINYYINNFVSYDEPSNIFISHREQYFYYFIEPMSFEFFQVYNIPHNGYNSIGFNVGSDDYDIDFPNTYNIEQTFYLDLVFVPLDLDDIEPDLYDNWNLEDYFQILPCPQKYIPYTLVEETITYPDNLSDNFYYAMDSMNNSDVFSWAKTSFLAEPFSYIFGLFGIPSGSPFITLLSYWLSISIIWLVFDLVMYVPLLVHGWIDKGGIE